MYFNNQRLLRQLSLSSVPVVQTCIVQDEWFPTCLSDFPLVWVIPHLFGWFPTCFSLPGVACSSALCIFVQGRSRKRQKCWRTVPVISLQPRIYFILSFLPYLFFYGFPGRQKHSCGREQTCRCWHLLQQELLFAPPRLLWRTFFIALVSEPVLKLAVGYVAQREHSQDPFHFWLNLAQLFFLL